MKRLPLVLILVLAAKQGAAQEPGTWPPRVQDILDTLAKQHPTWVADDNGPPETSKRFLLNKMFAEQVCFELGPQYGMKRAGVGRPISSEVLAFRGGDPPLVGWEWENTHDGHWEQFPPAIALVGQIFVPATCTDHLGTGGGGGAPPDPSDDLASIRTRLDLAEAALRDLQAAQHALEDQTASLAKRDDELQAGIDLLQARPIWVDCVASVLGFDLNCRLEKGPTP